MKGPPKYMHLIPICYRAVVYRFFVGGDNLYIKLTSIKDGGLARREKFKGWLRKLDAIWDHSGYWTISLKRLKKSKETK